MVGIILDTEDEYLYVSTMHDVQESKILRRLHSGRINVKIIIKMQIVLEIVLFAFIFFAIKRKKLYKF